MNPAKCSQPHYLALPAMESLPRGAGMTTIVPPLSFQKLIWDEGVEVPEGAIRENISEERKVLAKESQAMAANKCLQSTYGK